MTILYVNTGTSANAGNGDSIRLAFTKVNNNFNEIVGDIAALNTGGFTTVTAATSVFTGNLFSTGTAYFNNAVFTGTISGNTVFENITVNNIATAYQFIGTNINVTNAAFHDVAITGSLTGNFAFASLTVTNTLTVGTLDALNAISLGDYTIAQANQYNDFSIIKNDVNGLALVLLNTQADSFNEVQWQDNISGGLSIVHQNSTNPSGNYAAGQNYIFGETPTDTINIGAYSDINFFASQANYSAPGNTYNNPLINIASTNSEVTFNTTVTFTSDVFGVTINGTVDWLNVHSDIIPSIDQHYNLGSPTHQWKSLYVSTNTIYINNVPLTINTATSTLQVGSVNTTTVVNIATEQFVLSQTTSTLVNGTYTVALSTSGSIDVSDAVLNFGQNSAKLAPPRPGGASDRVRIWDFQNINPSGVNYAIGAEGSHMWFSTDVVDNTGGFKFYSTSTQVFKIGGDGSLNFADGSIQTTAYTGGGGSGGVVFRSVDYPTGASGDTQGSLAYNTLTNRFYLATASYVQQTLTTSTFDVVANQDYDWGQSGDQFMSVTISKGAYPGIDTLLNDGVTTGWTISGTGIVGTVAVTDVSLHNTDNVSWSFDWAPQEGQPTSFSSGTAFTLYNTVTPAQPNIWEPIVTGQVWQMTSSTETLSMYNPYTDYIELATNSSTRMSIYSGQGFELANLSDLAYGSWNWNQETTGTIVYQGIYNDVTRGIAIENYHNNSIDPYVLFDNNGGIQFNDYTTNPLGYPAILNVPFASISRTTGTMTIGVTDFSVNTGTTATWTFSAPTKTLTHPGTFYSKSTATVSVGVNNIAWANFLAGSGSAPVVVQDVQYDNQGNVVATFYDWNTGTTSTYTTGVVKYTPEGQSIWAQQLTGPVNPITFGLAIDAQNNIYLNLVDAQNSGSSVTYILKLDGVNGGILWATELEDLGDTGYNALISPDGNLVVNGVYQNGSNPNAYVAKINTNNGAVIWQVQSPDLSAADIDSGLAIDSSGNITISGTSYNGPGIGFITRLDTNGNLLNSYSFLGTNTNESLEISDAINDSQGNLYISGGYYNTSTVQCGFLAKFNPTSGEMLWAYQIGSGNGCVDITTALAVDPQDNVYVTGITLDPTANNGSGLLVQSLGSFNSQGTELWQYWFETPDNYSTVPGALLTSIITNENFEAFGNNISYYNGMLSLGVVATDEGNFYPYVLQVPANGSAVSFTGDMLTIYSTTSSWTAVPIGLTITSLTATVTAGTLTAVTTSSITDIVTSVLPYEYDYTSTVVTSIVQNWNFTPAGGLVFPDGTTQTTAYGGTLSTTTNSGGYFSNVQVSIKETSGYVRISSLGNSAQTWMDLAGVGAKLGVNPYWISGMIIDYQVLSSNLAGTLGNMVGQIILVSNNGGRVSVTHSETAMTENDADGFIFANLNMWYINNNTLQVVRTDGNSGQQLDIIWTAKVFINPSENYC